MLFTGTYPRSLDEKQRLALPKRIRDSLGDQSPPLLYLTPGTDGSLAIYTEDAFSRLGHQMAQGASPHGQDTRAFSRLFYAQAEAVEVDGQGRLRIPAELARLAGFGREVMLLGVRDHLELWDKAKWEEYLRDQQPRYDQLAEDAFRESVGGFRRAAPGEAASVEQASERPTQPR
jgi:MraZ protein